MSDSLTSDNTQLSEVSSGRSGRLSGSAVDSNRDYGPALTAFLANSIAPNSRRAFLSDLAHFLSWGGHIPSSDTALANYLAAHADMLSAATLVRRLASISKAHRLAGLSSPVASELIRATMRGIKRTRGSAQREAKPLLRDDLLRSLDAMTDSLKATRDAALLLIGFAGGLRRSELVGLDVGDIQRVRLGIVLHLRRSKTDQIGYGHKIGIPHGRSRWCPVGAIEIWLAASGITDGPIFRPVDRHGHVYARRLSSDAVSVIVKERVARAGLEPSGFSGHSLRAGLATSAAQAGVPIYKIKAQTRHASDSMLNRYIRDGQLFVDNAAGVLL